MAPRTRPQSPPRSNRQSTSRWLLADIGGTYARLAAWQPDLGPVSARKYSNEQFPDLASVLRSFLQQLDQPCRRAALAVALPVRSDRLEFTNRAWSLSAGELRARLDLDELRIVNDFAAAAAGLAGLRADETQLISDPARPTSTHRAPKVLLGPGTGLGVAAVIPHEPSPVIVPSEAGHVGCYAIDATTARLLDAAQEKWGRVSWERLISGPGLAWIEGCLRGADEPLAPSRIAANAMRERRARVRRRGFFRRWSAPLPATCASRFVPRAGSMWVAACWRVWARRSTLGRSRPRSPTRAGCRSCWRQCRYSACGRRIWRSAGCSEISSGLATVPGLRVVKSDGQREDTRSS